jgi:hypothetical protein
MLVCRNADSDCRANSADVAALSIRRVVEAYSKGGLLTNDQPEAQRQLL